MTLLDLALIAGDPLGDEALEKAKLFGVDVEAVMNGLRANERVGFCRSARVRGPTRKSRNVRLGAATEGKADVEAVTRRA